MAFHQMHLNKSGSGMASKTACGRNILRTPMSTNWNEFKALPHGQQCAKCAASKQAAVNAKHDAKNAPVEASEDDLSGWIPVDDTEAWKAQDDALIAAHKAKQGK